MDVVIDLLYAIPVIGLLFQFGGYLVATLPDVAPITLRAAVPIAFAALCGVLCERSGVVNLGVEGMMLTAAFVGWAAGVFLLPVFGQATPIIFGITPALALALVLAVLAGMLVATLHAWLSISVRADQVISGTIINIAAFGITGYLNTLMVRSSPRGAGAFSPLSVPNDLDEVPLLGWLVATIVEQGPLTISVLIFVIVMQVLLFRSRWGLRTRAVGEHPRAAETVGVDVIRLRYKNVIASGAIAALGGAFLSMEATASFQTGMTAGRGFIGLAAVIVGRWSPLGAFGAALLFASAQGLGQSIKIVKPSGELGALIGDLPGQVFDALPYVVTIIVLAGLIGRSSPPAASGRPYEREATA